MQLTKRLEPSVHCFGGNIVFKQINSEFRIGFRVGWVCFVEVVNTISFDDVVAQKDQESNDQQDSGYQTDDEDDERNCKTADATTAWNLGFACSTSGATRTNEGVVELVADGLAFSVEIQNAHIYVSTAGLNQRHVLVLVGGGVHQQII